MASVPLADAEQPIPSFISLKGKTLMQNNHVQTVSTHVGVFVDELKNAIVTSMAAAAEGIRLESDVARVLQRMEAFHAVLEGIDAQKATVRTALEQAESNAQRASLCFQLTLLDQQAIAVLTRSGVDPVVANQAIESKDDVRPIATSKTSSKRQSRNGRSSGKGQLTETTPA
jgi:hypothetical protein